MHTYGRLFLVGTLVALMLAACTAAPAEQIQSQASPSAQVAAPSSDTVGNVAGTLLRIKDGKNEAFVGIPLYLGDLVASTEGVEGISSLSRETAPKTYTEDSGAFVFADVPVGRYTLWLDTPRGPVMLNEPTTGGDLIITVDGGKISTLGSLPYDIPFPE
ncbi:MAG: hypothetical protein H7Z42_18565 [Roseiflexaceae bacterium]|nr:hypothetical protein [Roseiflexaceae bacterium]